MIHIFTIQYEPGLTKDEALSKIEKLAEGSKLSINKVLGYRTRTSQVTYGQHYIDITCLVSEQPQTLSC